MNLNRLASSASRSLGQFVSFLAIWAIPVLGSAQSADSLPAPRQPGIVYGGQYFGFDPVRWRRDSAPAGEVVEESFGESSDGLLEEYAGSAHAAHDGTCCDDDPTCGYGGGCVGPSIWARGEFLFAWMKGMHVPALATTSPNGGILPDGTVLFGSQTINGSQLPAARVTLGGWLDESQCHGLEAGFLWLGQASTQFQGDANDFTVLARPFTNVDPANLGADARLIVSPNVATGSLSIVATSQFMTFDALYRRNITNDDCCVTDVLLGYRHAQLRDQIQIDENTTSLTTAIGGTNFLLTDQFSTRNQFNGAELGVFFQRRWNECWTWDVTAKGAIGQNQASIGINGRTRTTPPGGTSTFTDSGLLAQSTNIGNYTQSDFTALGDFTLNLRRKLPCGWTANVGYAVLVWGSVQRAGDQIDLNVNASQIPPGTLTGDPRPFVPFAASTFWVHGVQLGIERAF